MFSSIERRGNINPLRFILSYNLAYISGTMCLMAQEKNLQQLFDEFVKECRYSSRLRSETVRGYAAVFQLFLLIMPEVIEAEFLTTEMLTEFFMRLQTRERIVGKNTLRTGVKNSTIKTYWSKLNSFFEWLHKKALIPEKPAQKN